MRTPGTLFPAAALIIAAALTSAACLDASNEPITGQPGGAGGSAGTGGGDAGTAGTAGGAGPAGTGGAGTAGTAGGAGTAGTAGTANGVPFVKIDTGKVDVLFVIDNSSSMADKQKLLARTVPDFVGRLVNPPCVDPTNPGNTQIVASPTDACPAGYVRQFIPATSMRVGFVTSSLGGHGSDYCSTPGGPVVDPNDQAHLITRRLGGGAPVPTYQNSGTLVWDGNGTLSPPGEQDLVTFLNNVSDITVGADQKGCGFESPLEAWYRFLVDPNPPATVATDPGAGSSITPPVVEGTDTLLLQQRAAFLRPDSLLMVVMLSDEDDCSIIDGVMPPDVCDTPVLDASGKPTGCDGPRVGWPAGYAEGNFQSRVTGPDGRVTGTPFPVNQVASQVNMPGGGGAVLCAPKLNPKVGAAISTQFCMPSGTAACETNPESPECKSCLLLQGDQAAFEAAGCKLQTIDDPEGDPVNLRCWDQKRRFGVDMLYPMKRYLDGLTKAYVYDRDGYLVANPLFASGRPIGSVLLTGIVGVPWQDIARDPNDLSKGYRPTSPTASELVSVDWSLILGNPLGYLGSPRVDPQDPMMIASNVSDDPAHPRLGQVHPVTNETISATGWNKINGHEWISAPADLQYACITDVPADNGDYELCTENDAEGRNNPLCEDQVSATDTRGAGTYTNPKQYRAKAYPAPRLLEALRGVGSLGVVNSICASNVADDTRTDFGYRPAATNILSAVAPRLSP